MSTESNPSPDLPTTFDPDLAFGYGEESPFARFSDALLTIDNDEHPGAFVYGGQVIGKELLLTFVARRVYRVLFAKDYDDLKDGEENEIVCRSADGITANGIARQPKPGEDWRKLVSAQRCADPSTGKATCPSASGDPWLCRPRMILLCMIHWPAVDQWFPAFFQVRGQGYRPTEDAFRLALRKMAFSKGRNEQGVTVAKHPLWTWAFQVSTVKPSQRRKGFAPLFGGPDFLIDPDRTMVDTFVRTQAKELWDRERADAEKQMAEVGVVHEDADAKPAPQQPANEPDDFGNRF